jgi:hypothetical protein
LKLRLVGDEGAEDDLSAISSVTMIGRLTGDSLRLVNRPKLFVFGRGVGDIKTVRSAMIKGVTGYVCILDCECSMLGEKKQTLSGSRSPDPKLMGAYLSPSGT